MNQIKTDMENNNKIIKDNQELIKDLEQEKDWLNKMRNHQKHYLKEYQK